MAHYFTSGQVAKQLRISISTLKRWLEESPGKITESRNSSGWRLFSEEDLEVLKEFKRGMRKKGKRFNDTTLIPVTVENHESSSNG